MKKIELTIVIEVEDDITPRNIELFDHDVLDGFEVILNHPNNTEKFKLKGFSLIETKELKGVTKEDIQQIAKQLGLSELNESQLNWVKLSYEDAQRQDPSATWNLIVEDLLYQLQEFDKNHTDFGEDASTDDCFFDYENDARPYHSDGDGDDNTLLNFMG